MVRSLRTLSLSHSLRMPRISTVDRNHLISAFEEGRDYVQLASEIGVSRRSAYRIVRTFSQEGRRRPLPQAGGRKKLISPEMVEHLVSWIQDKPTITLEEMRGKLFATFPALPPNLSLTTISRALDGSLITLKLLRSIPTQWNASDVKEERVAYVTWFFEEATQRETVFVDECGFNVWTSRTQGRSARGSRAVRMVSGSRGKNLTVCMAVSPRLGLVHFSFVEGGMNKELFMHFIGEVSALLADENVFIIYDNAPPHRDCPPPHADDHDLKTLPRYSPFLNMTERAISCVKSDVKRKLTEPSAQAAFSDHVAAAAEGITLQRHRLNLLKHQIEEAMNSVTPAKCFGWNNQSLRHFQACLDRLDIFD